MSWLEQLHAELGRAGIRGRTRRRIELELADHVACEPGCESRLGTPREVAERFASELRIVRTRRATWVSFAALALVAFGMLATTRAYSAAGGWPDASGARGLIVALTGILILFAPQVAFVAGMLGAARGYRIRRGGPTGEVALVQYRMRVAVVAGAVTLAGMLVHVVALWSLMPAWWDAVALASIVAPAAALAGGAALLLGASAVTPAAAARGLEADLPGWLPPSVRGVVSRPAALVAAVGIPVSALVLAGTAHAEGSLLEGLERGVAEGLVLVACFAVLGRRLGLRR